MIKEQGPACSHTAGDCGGEESLTCLGIFLGFQRIDEGLSRNTCRILLGVALVEGAACVGGEDNNGILEGDILVQITVSQSTGIQYLQKQMDGVQMGFFYLVEQQDAVGIFFHKSSEGSFLCAGIAFLKTHKPHIGLMIGKAGHVKALIRNLQRLRSLFRKESLAYTGRPGKYKDGAGTLAFFV